MCPLSVKDCYFLFPVDEEAQNFNVVTLPSFTPVDNPVTVHLPSRRDAAGQPLPAGARDEVWIPLVSLTKEQAANAGAAGTIFVDVYDQRLGHKLLSTTLPFTTSPNELFKAAFWIEGGYLLLPLNASLDSFALWQLP